MWEVRSVVWWGVGRRFDGGGGRCAPEHSCMRASVQLPPSPTPTHPPAHALQLSNVDNSLPPAEAPLDPALMAMA